MELLISIYGEVLATLMLLLSATALLKKTSEWTFVRGVSLKTKDVLGRTLETLK